MRLIDARAITVKIGRSSLLDDVSFSVEKGDFLCITGPNGAGKTTLLKTLLGLLPIASGEIAFFGETFDLSKHRGRIGYLPQKNVSVNPLFPVTSEEVVLLGLMTMKRMPKRATAEDRVRAHQTLGLFGAEELSARSYTELSGGQQQKVMLARALVHQPEIVFFDEPSTALDPESREEFFALLQNLHKEQGLTIVMVTHDMDYVGHYATTLLSLDRTVQYFGPAKEFLHKHHITHHHCED
jgi:zinc transport system ATP-binding protein